MITEDIKNLIQKALSDLQFEVEEVALEHPENPEHGDYSTNVALILAKQLGKNPREVADDITAKLKAQSPEFLLKIEVAGAGFVNFFLSPQHFLKELREILKRKEKYGAGKSKKAIVVDYSGPNIAKPFGIGHLRSTIIGQAVYNLYKFQGWKTIGDNHLGDWGTQFGKLLYQVIQEKKENQALSVEELEQIYVRFHAEAQQDASMEDGAREWFKKLEQGDKQARRIWKVIREVSLKEFDRVYKLLDLKIDYALGESFYEPMLKDIIEEAKSTGLAKESRGALIIEFPEDKLPPAILLKSDEATNYFTRDLAAVQYRLSRWKPDLVVYEVGSEQSLHLQQVFFTAELLGWAKRDLFRHIAHGLYRTETGKFSTRKGQTIHLEEILKEAIERAREIIERSETARGLSEKEKEKVAKAVGIGGVKYNDLMQHPSRDIVFDWDKILNLKGNSAAYLQYTYARCKSILRRSKLSLPKAKLSLPKFSAEEMALLRLLYRFPEVVQEAAEKFSPNLVCNFVFDVAQRYNLFYSTNPVLKAETKELQGFRLLLTAAVAQIIENSLMLLGIKTLERM